MNTRPFRNRGRVFRDEDDAYEHGRQQEIDAEVAARGVLWGLLLAARHELRRGNWQQAARHLSAYHYWRGLTTAEL